MRKLVVAAAFLLVSTAASAQQDNPTGIFVFVTNPGYGHSDRSGSYWDGAFGMALQRMFTPHVSAELTVSRDHHTVRTTAFDQNGDIIDSRTFTSDSTPVDLTARYHFFTDGAWKPYVGAGVRYVESRAFGDLTGGVVWQFRPSLGLRFDGKVVIGHQPGFNDTFNGSAGLAWRF
jgi:outer membrane protein W